MHLCGIFVVVLFLAKRAGGSHDTQTADCWLT